MEAEEVKRGKKNEKTMITEYGGRDKGRRKQVAMSKEVKILKGKGK